ncbi:hypothetical protein NDU88_002321 [Pleurodeles waltl]|uniref:Uncharacterized protein n=1 Tax=Pleurodeles waltl TaxID=8319 RepID=A0AAV7Q8J2_PLEWA|nr:hypothetical protein NDU88_002321 [Pleurodeles waltl]
MPRAGQRDLPHCAGVRPRQAAPASDTAFAHPVGRALAARSWTQRGLGTRLPGPEKYSLSSGHGRAQSAAYSMAWCLHLSLKEWRYPLFWALLRWIQFPEAYGGDRVGPLTREAVRSPTDTCEECAAQNAPSSDWGTHI